MTSLRVGPTPIAIIPTGYVSPSSSAFMACVVLWATKSISSSGMSESSITRVNASSMPSETPLFESCVVGTVDTESMEPSAESSATAFVNVPPTSIPIRILRRGGFAGDTSGGGKLSGRGGESEEGTTVMRAPPIIKIQRRPVGA